MPELGFHGRSRLVSDFRARDISPDSIVFMLENNFSLFSPASASVGRSSFASDVLDHGSPVSESEISQHLTGHDSLESSNGPNLDPNKPITVHNVGRLGRRGQKTKAQKEGSVGGVEGEYFALGSARSSFSLALKECHERRFRSETHPKNRRRPASLDFSNNIMRNSPKQGVIKNSASTRKSGSFPSPGTPNYRHTHKGMAMQKGWSSERVPLPHNGNSRQFASALLPYNTGRTLPSKWEDAERWIFSPVAGDNAVRSSFQPPQRRQKSKSGPLGPPGVACYSLYSPAGAMFEGGNTGNFMTTSPFSAGVLSADRQVIHGSCNEENFLARTEPCMSRSVSVRGCSEMPNQTTLFVSKDEKVDCLKDAATDISRAASRRDMATQMSPDNSNYPSPRRPSTSSVLLVVDSKSVDSSKSDVRDVQVDERVTVTRRPSKPRARTLGKGLENVDAWRKQAADAQSSAWEVSGTAKSISKIRREEAKVTAWENLQKAKAEAAIRNLEMKLEKKRSSSIDKIMNKLKLSQKKAQEMRSYILANQDHQATPDKVVPFRRTRQIGSLSGCFACHAF